MASGGWGDYGATRLWGCSPQTTLKCWRIIKDLASTRDHNPGQQAHPCMEPMEIEEGGRGPHRQRHRRVQEGPCRPTLNSTIMVGAQGQGQEGRARRRLLMARYLVALRRIRIKERLPPTRTIEQCHQRRLECMTCPGLSLQRLRISEPYLRRHR
jgi:hypothetical protein